jgi:hypothetical protein
MRERHSGGEATADPPRPLRRLGQAVIGLLGLVILVNLIALWADMLQLALLTDVRDGQRVTLEQLTESDDRVTTTVLLQSGTYVACTIAFLIWYGRAYRNVARMGADGLRWGRRWAIAYWFIPIANLFRPKQVVNDIWRASDPDLPPVAHHWADKRVPALFHWWWALWILSSAVSNVLFRRSLEGAQTPDELVSVATTYVVIDVIDIIPAVLAMLVVRAITNRQEERRVRYERGELPEAAPVAFSPPAETTASPG